MTATSIHVLGGSDRFLIDRHLNTLYDSVFKDGQRNIEKFNFKEHTLQNILDHASTLPMFCSHKACVIDSIKDLNEKQETLLDKWIENPARFSTLILIMDKIDRRKKWFKSIEQKKALYVFDPPKLRDMGPWVDQLAKSHGLKIGPQSSRLLIDHLGPKLALLDQELEKIKLYLHPQTLVEPKHVELLVLKVSGEHVFALADQFFNHQKKSALQTLAHLLNEGTPALVILSLLFRHIKVLLKSHECLNMSPSQAASTLGVPPFAVQNYINQSKKNSPGSLQSLLEKIAFLDRELKSSGINDGLLIEKLILEQNV